MYWAPVIAILFFAYALFSKRLSHSPITGPMIFTAAGVVVGLILDAQGATPQSMSLELRGSAVQTLLEGTLVIILFSDAAVINLAAVKRDSAALR
ncbi:MAG: hypothetical protein ABFR53_10220 [Actinomycetota bacterium]